MKHSICNRYLTAPKQIVQDNIARVLALSGLDKHELSAISGVSVNTVRLLMQNISPHKPSIGTSGKICAALKISLNDLLQSQSPFIKY